MIILCPLDSRTLPQFEEAVRDAVTHISGAKFDHNIVIADTAGTAFTCNTKSYKGKFHLQAFRPGGPGSRPPKSEPSSAASHEVYSAVMRELIERFPLATITVGRVRYFYDKDRQAGRYSMSYRDKLEEGNER